MIPLNGGSMDLIKTWRKDGFTLRMWDTFKRDWRGQTVIHYQLKDGRKEIFQGDDFSCSPMHSDDSLHSVCSLLGFLSTREGDTDKEYFAKYTPEQLDWTRSNRCEQLSMIQYEMEERLDKQRRR